MDRNWGVYGGFYGLLLGKTLTYAMLGFFLVFYSYTQHL